MRNIVLKLYIWRVVFFHGFLRVPEASEFGLLAVRFQQDRLSATTEVPIIMVSEHNNSYV